MSEEEKSELVVVVAVKVIVVDNVVAWELDKDDKSYYYYFFYFDEEKEWDQIDIVDDDLLEWKDQKWEISTIVDNEASNKQKELTLASFDDVDY